MTRSTSEPAAAEQSMSDLDRGTILGFVNRGGVKYHAAKEAMQRLVDGALREHDIERLVEFVADNDDRYPRTCEALASALKDPKLSSEDRECVVAYLAAKNLSNTKRDSREFYWDSRKESTGALRVVNAAIKNDGGAPWPAWTTEAIAAGWKAPNGWKP